MTPFSHLHDALKSWLAPTDWAHQTHLTVALLMVAALIHTGTVNLTKWALCLPNRGDKQRAQSQQRRLSRWLHNARINVHRIYKPLITQSLADWSDPVMYVALDTSLFWEEYCLVRLAVVHRGRSLPLCWCVLHHPSASVAYDAYAWILKRAAGCIPKE
ncbi:MAG: transposase, partial [Moorea sp. SIO3H5]|nr:transposase [Moorena sp. SIO3H5]